MCDLFECTRMTIKTICAWLQNNVGWLKDLMWIIFTAIATIIAIKTYKNAKKSIFQPLNTEVIKQQSSLFIKIYHLLKGNIFDNVDYSNSFFLNIYSELIQLGYAIDFPPEMNEDINELLETSLVGGCNAEEEYDDSLGDEKSETFVEKVCDGNLDAERTGLNHIVYLRDPTIRKGENLEPIMVYPTKKSAAFLDELEHIISDPFLPTTFKDKLSKLADDIRTNSVEKMMSSLQLALNSIWLEEGISNEEIDKKITFWHNYYVDVTIKHDNAVEEIFLEMNKYLKVDTLFE